MLDKILQVRELHDLLHEYWNSTYDNTKIIDIHNKVVKRMITLNINHKDITSLDSYLLFPFGLEVNKSSSGIYQNDDELERLLSGKSKYIISIQQSNKYLDKPIYLLSRDDKIQAKIKITDCLQLDEVKYIELQDKIGMSIDEAKKRFGKFRIIYAYPITILETYENRQSNLDNEDLTYNKDKSLTSDELINNNNKSLGEGQDNNREGTDYCYCPECDYKIEHNRSIPCNELECPKCHISLTGVDKSLANILGSGAEFIHDKLIDDEIDKSSFNLNKDDKGKYVLHEHIRGLSEEEAKTKEYEHIASVHSDLRLLVNNTTKLNVLSLTSPANTSQRNKLINNKKGDRIRIIEFKTRDKKWLTIDNHIVEPNEGGATKYKYARYDIVDKGTFKVLEYDKHFIQIEFNNGKMKGIWNLTAFPSDEERIWQMQKKE